MQPSNEGDPIPPNDNLYSPANHDFYKHQPYQPLDRHVQEVRLLRVTKDVDGSLLCTLTDGIPLAEARDTYTAISYCAGDPNTRPLLVNGYHFNAFANLVHAIEEAYNHRTDRSVNKVVLWANQMVINQSDATERSHQVGFMRAIYSNAQEVAVCLSTTNVDSDAISWIERVYEQIPELESVPAFFAAQTTFVERDDDIVPGILREPLERFGSNVHSNLHDGRFVGCWLQVLEMVAQPWWQRAWVLQEHVTTPDARFFYGGKAISWKPLTAVLLTLFTTREWILNGTLYDTYQRFSPLRLTELERKTPSLTVCKRAV